MSCLFAVTTDLPACERPPDEIARRLEPAHQLDDDVGVGCDDGVDAVGPVDAGRHPVDFLPLDAAVADGRQLQRRMNPARQHFRHRAADRAKADNAPRAAEIGLPRPSARCRSDSTLLLRSSTVAQPCRADCSSALLPRLDRHRIQKRHHASQLRADLFDLMVLLGRARLVELRAACLVLLDPVLREGAVLDFVEQLLHRLPASRRSRCAGPPT